MGLYFHEIATRFRDLKRREHLAVSSELILLKLEEAERQPTQSVTLNHSDLLDLAEVMTALLEARTHQTSAG